jgi:hypothetical protein
MEIDCSDRQYPNADSPRIETRLPDSNVKSERSSQHQKQSSPMVSTDEGMQIDRSEEHDSNADFPRTSTLQPDSNFTDDKQSHFTKQPVEIALIVRQIVTSSKSPKYRTRQVSLEPTRQSPEIPKNRFPGSISGRLIPEPTITEPEN